VYTFDYTLDGSGTVTQTDLTDPEGRVQRAIRYGRVPADGHRALRHGAGAHDDLYLPIRLAPPHGHRRSAVARDGVHLRRFRQPPHRHRAGGDRGRGDHHHDALNRQTFVGFGTTGAPPTYASTITTTYDAGDRATEIVDSVAGTIERTYDLRDRLTEEVTPEGTVSYTYDAAGRRAQP
jgi:hypothetical protein